MYETMVIYSDPEIESKYHHTIICILFSLNNSYLTLQDGVVIRRMFFLLCLNMLSRNKKKLC
jgi:hypothetical protein